jgi:hypothetical protein
MAAVVGNLRETTRKGPSNRTDLLLYVRNSRLEVKDSCGLLMS